MKTQHVLTAIYHPQSNGKNERSHAILKEYIRHYQTESEPWDIILPKAMLNYNCTINRNTGYTPFELQLGYEPNSIFDEENEYLSLREQIDRQKLQHENKIEELKQTLTEQQPSVSYEHLEPISPGTQILIRNYNPKPLEPKWRGLFIVSEVTNKHTVKVNENGKQVSHHRTNVKVFKQRINISDNED